MLETLRRVVHPNRDRLDRPQRVGPIIRLFALAGLALATAACADTAYAPGSEQGKGQNTDQWGGVPSEPPETSESEWFVRWTGW